MAKIAISRAEFVKGWTRARSIHTGAQTHVNNAHRLMLFYAVENGLKALIMRIELLSETEASFAEELHDINKLLVRAKAAAGLFLTQSIKIKPSSSGVSRNCAVAALNQLWRYGCVAENPSDAQLEEQLIRIAEWIEENME